MLQFLWLWSWGLALSGNVLLHFSLKKNAMISIPLANHLAEFIVELQKKGLDGVATVCDQYDKAAINHLVTKSKEDCLKRGSRTETFTFLVGGKEIITLFDPPHLLKGIRNNMLTGDVRFSVNGGILSQSLQRPCT